MGTKKHCFFFDTFKNIPLFILTMAHDRKLQMPSGMGGLVRYFDEYRSKIEIKPGHVIVICVLIIVVLIILHASGKALLGF